VVNPTVAVRSSPLRLPAFRRVAVSYLINELGNGIGEIALAILVFDRTRSPLATAAMFVALRAFPAVLAPLLAARLEISSARHVLAGLYLAEGAVFAAIALLARSFSLPVVLVLCSLDGILAVTARALVRSANASLLADAGLLRQGNAIMSAFGNIGASFGPALAGVLVAAAGAGVALGADAASFGVATAILFGARELPIVSDHTATTAQRLRAGLGEAWKRPDVRGLLIVGGLGMLFGTVVIPIEVVFAKRTLHAGDAGYGFLIGAWAIGMVAGSAAFAAAGRVRLNMVLAGGIVLIALGYLGLALAPDLLVACGFSALGGVGNTMWVTSVATGLQERVTPTARSSVLAVLGSIYQVAPAVGYTAGGIIVSLGSPRTAYAVAAAGVATVLLVKAAQPGRVAMPHETTQFDRYTG
jgi:hypothetical protein